MIDLERLDKEIDELFEQETCYSLFKWLLSKRFGNINNVVGTGTKHVWIINILYLAINLIKCRIFAQI